ncbi:ATV_HP_G0156690.mRNA.1.CDS.1 [Saccharomyces cerevisiae]|nr:ATV_HP_G0156690.mRNA.1.CDS.1 [Saccharomyces cerevisiae]CAI6935786.1 ATV_HP_G0156690.mRNA.1.CDS.1 [Saccharomyces cerevisiae]
MVSRSLSGLPLTHDKTARDLPQLSSQLNSIPYYSAPHDPSTRHHYLNVAQAQPRANSTPQLPFISSIINNSSQTPVTTTTTSTTTATSSPGKFSSSPNSSVLENNRLNSQQFKSIFTSPSITFSARFSTGSVPAAKADGTNLYCQTTVSHQEQSIVHNYPYASSHSSYTKPKHSSTSNYKLKQH